jgi:hypothetical protein
MAEFSDRTEQCIRSGRARRGPRREVRREGVVAKKATMGRSPTNERRSASGPKTSWPGRAKRRCLRGLLAGCRRYSSNSHRHCYQAPGWANRSGVCWAIRSKSLSSWSSSAFVLIGIHAPRRPHELGLIHEIEDSHISRRPNLHPGGGQAKMGYRQHPDRGLRRR